MSETARNQQLMKLRSRKLGALIKDARLAARQESAACAEIMGVSIDTFTDYEKGSSAPSLPEIEALAYFLNTPLDHFWGSRSISENMQSGPPAWGDRLRPLRDRLIGVRLRSARNQANLSLLELSEACGASETDLKQYELGQKSIPLPLLEVLASTVGLRLEEFYDQRGPIGAWFAQQQTRQKFEELPAEIQDFVCKPVNRPYLDLAMRLSELNVDKLRAVAESLLEITY